VFSWTAGIVDGEGSILIARGQWLVVKVTNTDPQMLEKLRELFGVGKTVVAPTGFEPVFESRP